MVLGITESKLDNSSDDSEILTEGYTVIYVIETETGEL